MIIDAEVHRYRQGGCFAMAQALAEITGLQTRCIDYGACIHAFVQDDDGSVIDLHGRHGWEEFIGFLVDQKCLPEHARQPGVVLAQPVPEPGKESVLWRHAGYKPPSASAIKAAAAVARRHPNMWGIIQSAKRKAAP